MFGDLDVSFKAENLLLETNEEALCCCMYEDNTKLLIATSRPRVVVINWPSMDEASKHSFALDGLVTTVRTFDALPQTLFLGLSK